VSSCGMLYLLVVCCVLLLFIISCCSMLCSSVLYCVMLYNISCSFVLNLFFISFYRFTAMPNHTLSSVASQTISRASNFSNARFVYFSLILIKHELYLTPDLDFPTRMSKETLVFDNFIILKGFKIYFLISLPWTLYQAGSCHIMLVSC